jgi:hypothetical protein
VITILLFLVLCGGVLSHLLSNVEEEDLSAYQQLLERSRHGNVQLTSSSAQGRERVVKDLWLTDGADRLHTRLSSERSELLLSYGERPTAVERMENVTGYMQEGLFYRLPDGRRARKVNGELYRIEGEPATLLYPVDERWTAMQEMRYLRAKQATYDYRTGKLLAEETSIIRFEREGHQLIETLDGVEAILSGTARTAEFTLGGKQLDFRAYHVKAKIFAQENLL